jgi:signal transduction histidine kinase
MASVRAQGPGILIVEDEAIVAHDLQQTLIEQGYDAFAVAASADEALLRAGVRTPDLVLMDIRLKGMRDGISAALELRKRYGVPVVYLTAHADDRTIDRAKVSEPYGYLLKPVSAAELKSVIEVALYKHARERQERERAEQVRAQEHKEALASRLSSLSTMAAGVAHELNSPLAVVVANAELVAVQLKRQLLDLRSGTLTLPSAERLDEVLEAQAELQAAANQIARVVANVRAFARPPATLSGQSEVESALDWAMGECADVLIARARVVKRIDAGIPGVKIEQQRLRQVLLHLLTNAAHAILPGRAAENEIRVAVRAEGAEHVAIEVTDTGSGMPPEVLERVFEPFFTTRSVGHGSGLGLSICHGIVVASGGTLSAESEPGRGSVFRVRLPALPSSAASGVRPVTLPPGLAPPVARPRVLLIDDEPALLRSMRRILAEHEVVCVESGREALTLIGEGARFDVIVSDLMMPGMTGIELYAELARQRPEYAQRVIFVTGGSLNEKVDRFLCSIPNPRLEKPFGSDELRRTIDDVLGVRTG